MVLQVHPISVSVHREMYLRELGCSKDPLLLSPLKYPVAFPDNRLRQDQPIRRRVVHQRPRNPQDLLECQSRQRGTHQDKDLIKVRRHRPIELNHLLGVSDRFQEWDAEAIPRELRLPRERDQLLMPRGSSHQNAHHGSHSPNSSRYRAGSSRIPTVLGPTIMAEKPTKDR